MKYEIFTQIGRKKKRVPMSLLKNISEPFIDKKIAGIFEAPPATLEEINNWAMSKLFAQDIYVLNDALNYYISNLEDTVKRFKKMLKLNGVTDEKEIEERYKKQVEDNTKNVTEAREKLAKKIKESKQYPQSKPAKFKSIKKTFKIDYTGWKYKNTIDNADDDLLDKAEKRYGKVKVILKGDFLRGSAKAYWKASNSTITMGGVTFGFKEALEHELEHWSQSFLSVVIGKDDSFGYPSRRMQNPRINQNTRDRKILKEYNTKDVHSMDDVEFYPEISDAKYKVLKYIKQIGKEYKKIIIKWYVGAKVEMPIEIKSELENIIPNKFFRTLKSASILKWKKAVKELIKQV